VCVVSALVCVAFGSVDLSTVEILEAIRSRDNVHWVVLSQLRFPRVLVAFMSGALLAMSGCLLQTLLRNPLADPYIFGISSGASLGVLMSMSFALGVSALVGGFIGAAIVVVSVAVLSNAGSGWNPYRLILTGVMVSAGLNAVISLILVLSPPEMMKGMLFWMMGDLTYAEPRLISVVMFFVILIFSVFYGRGLDVLSLGSERASTIGVSVRRMEVAIYVLAAMASAVVVVEAGAIGFIGLVVPHMVRMIGIWQHQKLVPLAAFVGGAMVAIADTLARSAWAPIQLPVGAITAILGVPILIYLLNRKDYARGR
jgi:iron complex transport system permease protein